MNEEGEGRYDLGRKATSPIIQGERERQTSTFNPEKWIQRSDPVRTYSLSEEQNNRSREGRGVGRGKGQKKASGSTISPALQTIT